ncbi:hypothetical protein DM860_007499 [Cuscuta australis]|uniref:Uncharacterized protein n=1 Tax=Cuscuta australis TaxID=267555 RepID=A0A328E8C0_9ASTE|nr:hypothetical protein DM860_007499 [Cuscuta australis]
MGKKSEFSFLGLFKVKKEEKAKRLKKKKEEEEEEEREAPPVAKVYYKIRRSDEDRPNWVADPLIDAKATAFLKIKRRQFMGIAEDDDDDVVSK